MFATKTSSAPKKITRNIVFIGAAETGKTELLYALQEGSKYQFPDKYEPTQGALFGECKKQSEPAQGEITNHLKFWDIAGVLKPFNLVGSYLHQIGVNENDFVVFTLDPTQDIRIQEDYLLKAAEQCTQNGVKGKFILAVTKNDIPRHQWKINTAQMQQLAGVLSRNLSGMPDIEIIDCSAKKANNEGVKELYDHFVSEVPAKFLSNLSQGAVTHVRQTKQHRELMSYIRKNVLTILITEKQRLMDTYGNNNKIQDKNALHRYNAVNATLEELQQVLNKVQDKTLPIETEAQLEKLKEELETPIRKHLDQFDKRKGSWGGVKKFARILLNAVLASTVVGPKLKKKWATNTAGAWFRLEGKTSLAGNEALENVSKAPGFKKKMRRI